MAIAVGTWPQSRYGDCMRRWCCGGPDAKSPRSSRAIQRKGPRLSSSVSPIGYWPSRVIPRRSLGYDAELVKGVGIEAGHVVASRAGRHGYWRVPPDVLLRRGVGDQQDFTLLDREAGQVRRIVVPRQRDVVGPARRNP